MYKIAQITPRNDRSIRLSSGNLSNIATNKFGMYNDYLYNLVLHNENYQGSRSQKSEVR